MTLLAPRLWGLSNAVRRKPVRYLLAWSVLGVVCWGILVGSRRGVRFLDGYPEIGTIADAVLQRSLEGLFVVLMVTVAFSVLTTAIGTLYASDDLPLLLSLPLAPARVFTAKLDEVFTASALFPLLLTLPVLIGVGVEREAAALFYPVALLATVTLFALPVALGAAAALVLMRLAPAGRVAEVATGANVVLAAGLVVGLRALRPERLGAMDPEAFERLLANFASLDLGPLPHAWASQATLAAIDGHVGWALPLLAFTSTAALLAVARLASFAYRTGWIRALDGAPGRRDARRRPAALWERPLAKAGQAGALLVKDVRLLLRDPRQWSQLLVLAALAGVYLVSTASLEVGGQRFRDALGTLNVTFLTFLLAGVGIRTAFPLVSIEGEGYWLVRTAPMRVWPFVLGKFAQAVGPMLILGVGIGGAAAALLDVSATLAWGSVVAGVSAALAITGLGVGLGAAFPRFDVGDPAQIPLSPGGMLYMGAALAYAVALTVLLAWPAWRALRRPDLLAWIQPGGAWVLAMVAALTALVTVGALAFGCARLARWEPGND